MTHQSTFEMEDRLPTEDGRGIQGLTSRIISFIHKKKDSNAFGSIRFGTASLPIVLGITLLVCFGYFLLYSGFYWDDWLQLLSKKLYGEASYWQYFNERPVSGWTHVLFGPILGYSVMSWKWFTLLLRYLSVLLAWQLVSLVWPGSRKMAALVALLFAVHPGFTQQLISVAYHQHWIQYVLFLSSLVFMVLSLRHQVWNFPLTLLSLITSGLQLSITEFFAGVELVRPMLIWVILPTIAKKPENARKRIAMTARYAIPYVILLGVFSVWRLFFFPLEAGDQNSPQLASLFAQQPLFTLLRLMSYALLDMLNNLVVIWGKIFDLQLAQYRQPVVLVSWLATIGISASLWFYLNRFSPNEQETNSSSTTRAKQAAWIGFTVSILGPAPLWVIDQNILTMAENDPYHADRFTLAAMLWVSLLFVGLCTLIIDRWKYKALVLSVVIGLCTGFQMRNANELRWQSQNQTNFFWQLSWRAPFVVQGTAFVTPDVLFPFQGSSSTSGAINLLYPQEANPDRVAYWFYAIRPRYSTEMDVSKSPVSYHTQHRIFTFEGGTPNSLLLLYNQQFQNCLWVLRPEDVDVPDLAWLVGWIPASNQSLIERLPAVGGYPDPDIFGIEPPHQWCYFYERAELEAQFKNWQEVAWLADQARSKGFWPDAPGSNSTYEWRVMVEGYAHTGRWQEAGELTLAGYAWDPKYASMFCNLWGDLNDHQVEVDEEYENAIQTVTDIMRCATR
jgi:hypothetical protein